MLKKVTIQDIVLSDDAESELYSGIVQYAVWKFWKTIDDLQKEVLQTRPSSALLDEPMRKYTDAYFGNLPKFRYWELGKFLIERYRPIKDKYAYDSDSRIPKTYRIHSQETYIVSRLDALIDLGLIKREGMVKAERNNTQTPLYSYTVEGCFLGWLIEARLAKDDWLRSFAADIVLIFLRYKLAPKLSVAGYFLVEFFEKCKKEGIFINFILGEFPLFVQIFPLYNNLRAIRHYLSRSIFTDPQVGKVFLETLEGLDEETRELVLLQFKLDIESDYEVVGVTKEWEIMRYNNIKDYRNITLLGFCEKCQSAYPFQINTYDFFGLSYTTKLNRDGRLDYDSGHKMKCMKCLKPGALRLIPYWWSPRNITGIKGFREEQIALMGKHKARLDNSRAQT